MRENLQIAKDARISEILETCKKLQYRAQLIKDDLLFDISWKEYTVYEIFADFHEKISKEFPDYLISVPNNQFFTNFGGGFVFIADLIEKIETYSFLPIFEGVCHEPNAFKGEKSFTLPIDEIVEIVYNFMMSEKIIAFKTTKN